MSEIPALLEAVGVSAGYGRMAVVRDLDLEVRAGEIVCLLGANGAGKSTTLATLAGDLQPLAGEGAVSGRAHNVGHAPQMPQWLAFATEKRSVIMGMSVADNLDLADVRPSTAVELFPALESIMKRRAGLCSGGEQQMLTLARALGRRPDVLLVDVLLVDELSLGLAPIVVDGLLDAVRAAADSGVGVLLVEQHVRRALTIADRVHVLERGLTAFIGTAAEATSQSHRIEDAYFSGRSPAPGADG